MKFIPKEGEAIEVAFEGPEVETIREVFTENAERLMSLGNDSSISFYEKNIAKWTGDKQIYTAASRDELLKPLGYFVDGTEEKVDEALDTEPPELRINTAAKRYELGYYAEKILKSIEATPSDEAIGAAH